MTENRKIRANDSCPCWSGKKYKKCCRGKIDWPEIIRSGRDQRPYLSIRGRNILFSEAIGEALQFDNLEVPKSLSDYKKAFTSDATRKIYEAVMEITL